MDHIISGHPGSENTRDNAEDREGGDDENTFLQYSEHFLGRLLAGVEGWPSPTKETYTPVQNGTTTQAATRQRSRPGEGAEEVKYDKTVDSFGRPVVDKPSNRAMLSGQKARLAHAERVAREASLRSLKASRKARRPASSSISWARMLFYALFIPFLLKFFTGSWTAGVDPTIYVEPYWRRLEALWVKPDQTVWKEYTPLQLAFYDGDPEREVLLAIDGEVYDVSKNRRVYGKGGSYNMMTGRDASRAFVTGCFDTHLTHDLRGLTPEELKSLDHWKSFFAKHKDYPKVGIVLNTPIDPSSPIPPPCREQAPGEAAADTHAKPGPVKAHGL